MTLSLDAETLAELGWGTDASESTTHYVSAPKPSRTPEGQVDGRHRRNWRRKATQCCKSTSDASTTQAHLQQEPA